MRIATSRSFDKQYNKHPIKVRKKFEERLRIFIKNQDDRILNKHILQGDWKGYNSINVTGDIRALYKVIDSDFVYFIAIGSHSELYS